MAVPQKIKHSISIRIAITITGLVGSVVVYYKVKHILTIEPSSFTHDKEMTKKNVGIHKCFYINIHSCFICSSSETETIQRTIFKWIQKWIKNYLLPLFKKMKRQVIDSEKVFSNHTSDKELIPRIYKVSNRKTDNSVKKLVKDGNVCHWKYIYIHQWLISTQMLVCECSYWHYS